MDMGKAMVPHRVDLDELLIGAANVKVVVVLARQRAKWRMNIYAAPFPPLVFVFHIHAAPTDMPNSRYELTGRRLRHFVKQDQRTFGEECIDGAVKLDRHGAKNAGIEANRFVDIDDVQTNV